MQVLLDRFQQQRFGASSEKNPGQGELQFFNEAEILLQQALDAEEQDTQSDNVDTTLVVAHKRVKKKNRALPDNLERIDVHHELDPAMRNCSGCG